MIAYLVDGPLNGQTREFPTHNYRIEYAVAMQLRNYVWGPGPDDPIEFKHGIYDYSGVDLPDSRMVYLHKGVQPR